MSTNEPQFGARSEDNLGQDGAPRPEQTGQPAGFHTPGQAPQAGYQTQQPGYQVPQAGYQTPQPGYQVPQPGYQTPQPGYPGPGQQGQMPKRTWPVLTLISGLVLMVVVAPVVFFSLMASSVSTVLNFDNLVSAAGKMSMPQQPVDSGSEGLIMVAPMGVGDATCNLIGADGEKVEATQTQDQGGDTAFIFESLTPNTGYQINCVNAEGAAVTDGLVLAGDDVAGFIGGVAQALLWGTVIGVVGLIALIVGIVWLVKVNRRRRQFLLGAGPNAYPY